MMSACDTFGSAINHPMFNPPAVFAPHFQRPPRSADQVVTYLDWALYARSPDLQSTSRMAIIDRSSSASMANDSFIDTPAYRHQWNRQAKAIAAFSVYWKKFLMDPRASVDVDAISESIDHIYEAIDQFGPGGIDLNNLRAQDVNGEHLAAILRATSSWKTLVPGWIDALQVAAAALKIANVDAEDALFGLV